jgi:hypothetical protein
VPLKLTHRTLDWRADEIIFNHVDLRSNRFEDRIVVIDDGIEQRIGQVIRP